VRWATITIVIIALVAGGLTRAASLRMSATFDEITLVAGGLRGVEQDRWDLIADQPPLMMALYGLATRSLHPTLPPDDRDWRFDAQWDYSRLLVFESGNDPQALLGRARLVTTVMAAVLVAVAGAFAWSLGSMLGGAGAGPFAGPVAGVLAAATTALLPDVLGHGGVAYNDVPIALAFLLALWALDSVVRRPDALRAIVAGAAVAIAFGVKMSALALLPIGAVLVALEAWSRPADRAWAGRMAGAGALGGLAAYLVLVGVYLGDPSLALLRFNFWRTVLHASGGHDAPAFLLGQTSTTGWWYYFPVAYLFKVPVGFTALVATSAVVSVRAWRAEALRKTGGGLASFAAAPLRAPLVGVIVFGAFLMRSDLNAGFRHALPLLPLLAVFASVGGVRFMKARRGPLVVAALVTLQAISVLSVYPDFLAYSSVLAGGRDRAYRVLVDSSLDWGQGLLELRSFMEEEGVEGVSLSYFGSARPEAYGIEYVALPSFFRLSTDRTPNSLQYPRFTVISATNLHGLYLQGRDPFVLYRGRTPYAVLGHSLFVFDEQS
jgi:hypothetical protein